MADIYLTNSLTRKKEKFVPINSDHVGMYTCGPTVYDYPTIGNYRTYTTADLLLRVLKFAGYKVKYVMNLTDVGHLTGDNEGDADKGEDRLEKASKREGKSAWDIAKFYSEDFVKSFNLLNLTPPDVLASATKHIEEQINLVKKLEQKGLTYKTRDGIYFDTKAFEKETGEKYGELSTLDQIKEGARVEANPEKRNPHDFALWKFSPVDSKRQMEWDSPWGVGFPGWHLECSAMSMEYLGDQFDIHLGGEDLRSTHHPNEIAQSEGATGKVPFVKYWIHSAFLLVDGGRMGKSIGNAYTLHDILAKGYDVLDLRYFYLTGHYKKQINFTFEALDAAKDALAKLHEHVVNFGDRQEELDKNNKFYKNFSDAVNDDLNMPQALAVTWEMVKSDTPDAQKKSLLKSFDEVLGLRLLDYKTLKIPQDIKALAKKRDELRKEGKFEESDKIRGQIEEKGYKVEDSSEGTKISK